MFSLKAYFWNNDVYINGQYKYAANEILTAYLNSNFIEAHEIIGNLRYLKKRLLISRNMHYEDHQKYSSNVDWAIESFDKVNKWITGLPPYNKILSGRIYTFDELLNEYSLFFEDGRDDSEIEDPITWETVTPNGVGDCDDNGVFYILLNKFVPISFEEIYFFDFDKIAHLEELNEKITAFFDEYIALLFHYASVQDIFKPFIKKYLNKNETFISDAELAVCYDKFKIDYIKNFSEIKCSMDSFGYKVLKNTDGNPILCDEITFNDLQSFLYFDFWKGIKNKYIPNCCKLCGRFFLIKSGKYFNYCNRPLKNEPDKTCRDVGSRRRYDDKCKNDPVWQTYNRAYKAHYARYLKNKMTVAQFEEWSRFASNLRNAAEKEKISFEDYYDKIRK